MGNNDQAINRGIKAVTLEEPQTMARDQVFISYSHEDSAWLARLQEHLKPLERKAKIKVWDDTMIGPEKKWKEEIQWALTTTKVAVLLVSPHFLASEFIHNNELPPLLAAAEEEGLTILWVLVSACSYQLTAIAKYQSAYSLDKPLNQLRPAQRDTALVKIVANIEQAWSAPLSPKAINPEITLAGQGHIEHKVLHSRKNGSMAVNKAVEGEYVVKGKNPDKTGYQGKAVIRKKGNAYTINWYIAGEESNDEEGYIDGSTLRFDFYPAVYEIKGDGTLEGKWGAGGYEKLMPAKGVTHMLKTILILAANPQDTSPLRLEQEVREIDNGLQRVRRREEFRLKAVLAARQLDVRRAMLDLEPNIVHFCGHGAGKDGIAFEDDMGDTKLVGSEALAGFFKLFADQVECVVLNACYSEYQAEAISQHINYVVGTSKAIGDKTAIEFAVAFYDAIGAGKSVDFAYELARNAIQWAGLPGHFVLKTKSTL